MYKLNQNLKTTIATKFGINIENSIRQGKPLSGPEFALQIDHIWNHIQLPNNSEATFMDGISLIADSERQLQEILNQTNLFFNK